MADAASAAEVSALTEVCLASHAEVVHVGLTTRGVRCDPLEQSDYAYSFQASTGGTRALVSVGHVGDEVGRQWLVFMNREKTGRLVRRKPADTGAIVQPLHRVVMEDVGAEPQ